MVVSSVAAEIDRAALCLQRAGIAGPRREATVLWAGLAGLSVADFWLRGEDVMGQSDQVRFREAVRRRSRGEPQSYVLKAAGFRKLDLFVDRRVLIPRPETESLVGHVIEWAARRWGSEPWGSIADIGTGSGCIALSLAEEGRFERVIATEFSNRALQVASRNISAVAPGTQVELRAGYLLEPLDGLAVDAIVSNPPYLTESEHRRLGPDVRDYEPREALVSGPDGLGHLRELLGNAMSYLKRGGLIAFELDSTRARETLELAFQAGWKNARLEPDLFGRLRHIIATKESA
ncbi:MAG: peptide chain release factor N(5)-glutamine methyltransferase [Gemmatimonadales bacterium]